MDSLRSASGLTRRAALAGGTALGAMIALARMSLAETSSEGALTMGFVTAKDGTEIFYKDWGSGQPIVFSHGWPLSSDAWDARCCSSVSRGSA